MSRYKRGDLVYKKVCSGLGRDLPACILVVQAARSLDTTGLPCTVKKDSDSPYLPDEERFYRRETIKRSYSKEERKEIEIVILRKLGSNHWSYTKGIKTRIDSRLLLPVPSVDTILLGKYIDINGWDQADTDKLLSLLVLEAELSTQQKLNPDIQEYLDAHKRLSMPAV